MITKKTKHILPVLLGLVLLIRFSQILSGFQGSDAAATAGADTPTQAAPMSEKELRALVAPIALYPDNLVAEVLAAATFPDQIAVANYWLQQHKNLTGNALTQAVDEQSWNASVNALTEFPSVLGNMAKSLSWTSQLGEAYHNQKSDVMSAIQALRKQAQAAGKLQSTPQMTVQQETPQTIVINSANPNVVYVPEYNPSVIYGYPYVTPGYSAADVAAAGALSFGAGIAIGAFAGSDWGWNAWGCDWHGGAVVYNHNAFYGNTAWHGGYAGGYHPYGADGGYHPYGNTFNRNVNRNTLNVNRADVQNHFSDANSWAHHDNFSARSNAFSGLSSHSGGFGGWSSRADSARGWGSMRPGGFGGFHGGGFGGGGFGGFGGFHGGGRR